MTRKHGLTAEEHDRCGRELAAIQETLDGICNTVLRGYRIQSRQARAVEAAVSKIRALRMALDAAEERDAAEAGREFRVSYFPKKEMSK
jgi:hypothetical protein